MEKMLGLKHINKGRGGEIDVFCEKRTHSFYKCVFKWLKRKSSNYSQSEYIDKLALIYLKVPPPLLGYFHNTILPRHFFI